MIEQLVKLSEASNHTHLKGDWALAIEVDQYDQWYHSGVTYEAKVAHTAAATDEPGVGANWETYWRVYCQGNAAIAATAINHTGAYADGITYTAASSMVSEAKSGRGKSWWLCKSTHVGDIAGGKNPTGASGATYWDEVLEGGLNGVSDLVASLDALTEFTGTPDGDVDYILGKFEGNWQKAKPDTYAKGYVLHEIDAGAIVPDTVSGCSSAADQPTTTNKISGRFVAFDDDQQRYGHFKYRLPLSYDGGAIKAYMELMSTGATSDSFIMGLQGRAVGDGESMDQAPGAAVEVTDACQGGAYKSLQTAIFNNIVLAGTPAAGKRVQFRVYRKPGGADNLTDFIYLSNIMLLVPVNLKSEV